MVKPTKNNIIVDPTDVIRKLKGGIELPDREKRANEGTVIAIGSEVKQVSKGDRVYFSEFCVNGREIKIDNKLYVVLKEDDILAIN
jgi:co-chaperonin GroES (HSP10)